MLCTNHDVVGHELDFGEHIILTRRLLVHWRKGGRLAVEPLCSAVHKECVRRLRVVVVAEAITNDIGCQYHHATCPYIIGGCFKRTIDVAVLQCRYDGSLIHEGHINFLSQAYPEGCLAQTTSD